MPSRPKNPGHKNFRAISVFEELRPMTVRVAINGFGRIGRLVLRSIIEHGRTD